ncbi:hypothetical protein [Neolewinella agarilytica]|uniref:Uncharacterized protein n=1 Tax=Neolewinella agarilytica TaxID=478744 RepID=A0A1H9N446_9BACT|nr:hypothetical protein [Neolewinella agarilytica]SER30557.1 hypothetical protein SAMN05444359_13345 [Neolewinella agarilytica]
MKAYITTLLCFMLATSLIWSQNTRGAASTETTDFSTVIANTNAKKGVHPNKATLAFDKIGTISEVNFVEKGGYEHIVFNFVSDGGMRRSFDLHLEFPTDFPTEIAKARVIHLGHQLIVFDTESEFSFNFFVPTKKNTVNHAKEVPTVLGIGLGISTPKRDSN